MKPGVSVDGEFGKWSQWNQCPRKSDQGEECQCRQRLCNQPEPKFGGKPCLGPVVQVANCTSIEFFRFFFICFKWIIWTKFKCSAWSMGRLVRMVAVSGFVWFRNQGAAQDVFQSGTGFRWQNVSWIGHPAGILRLFAMSWYLNYNNY